MLATRGTAYTSGMERILVTGAATWVGGHCVRALEPHADVIAVDELPPRIPFDAPFHPFHLDSLEFAHFVLKVEPTTVLHLQTLDRSRELGQVRSREGSVLGAQALFGALARAKQIQRVIVKSDTAIYSTGPRHASVLSERTRISGRATRYERNLREIERFVTEMERELEQVSFSVLRLASIVGPTIANPISQYLSLPVVPVPLGADPRLQFLHEDDAIAALLHAAHAETAGLFNVAGDGIMYLHRMLRMGRRLAQPLPPPPLRQARRALKATGLRLPEHTGNLLRYGRFVDTALMRSELAFQPRYTTRQTVSSLYGLGDN